MGHTVIRKSGNGWSYLRPLRAALPAATCTARYGPVASSAVAFDEAPRR